MACCIEYTDKDDIPDPEVTTDDVSLPTGSDEDVISKVLCSLSRQPSVLEGNSSITINSEREEYVSTPALAEADEILQNTGRVVLCGPPGSGKTTLANALCRLHREEGFSPYTLEGLELWRSNVGQKERSVVVLDGLFGHVVVLDQQYSCWRNIIKTVLQQIQLKMCLLVITVYPHILRELQQMENHPQSPFKDSSAVVRLTGDVPAAVKEQLLDFHLSRVPVGPDRRKVLVESILQKDVSGPVFPWCCNTMVKNWMLAEDPTWVFSTPAEAYTELLKDMVLSKVHEGVFAAVFVLAMRRVSHFLHSPAQAPDHLKELGFDLFSNDTLASYTHFLRESILSGSTFSNRVLYEAAGLAIGRYFRFVTLLKVCDALFLVQYVTVTVKERMADSQAYSLCVTVGCLPSCCGDPEQCAEDLQALVERIYTDITQGDLSLICRHPCLQCPQFLQQLDKYCAQDVKRISQILNAVDPEHKLPLVYWSIYLPSRVLTQWCVSKIRHETKLPVQMLLACSLVDHVSSQDSQARLQDVDKHKLTAEHFVHSDCRIDLPLLEQGKCLTEELRRQIDILTEPNSGHKGLLRYLHAPSLPIPPGIVTFQKTDDAVIHLQVEDWRHWYLVFRLLSDREVSETDAEGNSLLHVAVSCGQFAAVRLCLEAGAEVTQGNNLTLTPYQLAEKARPSLSKVKSQIDDVFRSFRTMDKVDVQLLLLRELSVHTQGSERKTGLHAACRRGRGDIAELYIELGADITAPTKRGLTALHCACLCPSHAASADITRLLLLQAGADVNVNVNARTKPGSATPLLYAAKGGHTDSAKLLMGHGADMKARDNAGATPLLHAVRQGHADTAELLVLQGADVNAQDDENDTALLCAVRSAQSDIAELLVLYGADVNAQDKDGDTPLLYATRSGRSELAKLLIRQGADVNAGDKDGVTPLMYAAKSGHPDTAELLIQRGAAVNTADEKGLTPLLYSARCGHLALAEQLVCRGANVSTQDKEGNSPLLCAARNGHTDIAQLLIHHDADVNAKNKRGDTPLLRAIIHGHSDTAELLIRSSSNAALDIIDDLNTSNCRSSGVIPSLFSDQLLTYPSTALHWACQNGMVQTVRLLLQHQPDITVPAASTPHALTALHLACLCRSHIASADIASILLQAGSEVNSQDDEGNTPLLFAARHGHSETAEMLLEHGADIHAQNKSGGTALLYAAQHGHCSTAELLIRHSMENKAVTGSSNTGLCRGHIHVTSQALLWACRKGMVQTAQELLQLQADVTATTTEDGQTALHSACLCSSHTASAHLADLLLQAGADVNVQDDGGNTPLLTAARNGHSDTAALLLGKGGDCNTWNGDGDTPLLSAAEHGHAHTAELLIRHGADVNMGNYEGDTPLKCAALNGLSELAELLTLHSAAAADDDDRDQTPPDQSSPFVFFEKFQILDII